jgi:hypothetical protein
VTVRVSVEIPEIVTTSALAGVHVVASGPTVALPVTNRDPVPVVTVTDAPDVPGVLVTSDVAKLLLTAPP